jgi:galactokinase/mevalonate kinase-like predicted kinase
VNETIVNLMKQQQFTKCYGPWRLMSYLRRMNITENKIPSYKQLQNPLEDKLRLLVFTGDESDEQPFVYHYKCDANNELILGDGTDE